MRVANVLSDCVVKTTTISPELSLADLARAICRADALAALVMENGRFLGVLSMIDILSALVCATNSTLAWNGPVRAALSEELQVIAAEEKVGQVIEKMVALGRDYLPVITDNAIVVVSLCRLLLAENGYLHGEVQHLQTYIDALHDAPND